MSEFVIQWAWGHSRSKHGARLVMLALADCAEDDGIAWPTVSDLMRMTALRERAVQMALSELCAIGELEMAYNAGARSLYQVNTYLARSEHVAGTAPDRPAIPLDLRCAVYERDGWLCVECGRTDDLTLDHVWPWSLGGPDTYENLRTLCRSCNSRKGARVERQQLITKEYRL